MFIVPFARTSAQFSAPVSDLVRYVDDLLDRQASAHGDASVRKVARAPKLDLAETDTGYAVTLDLPGVAREDVQVSVEGRRVTLKAELRRNDERTNEAGVGERIVWRERSVASFERSFVLPEEVDQASSNARLENGVLTLTLAKRQPAASTRIAVN